MRGAELVQECIPEQLALKRDLFARLSSIARPDAILASSTSGLKLGEIAAGCDAQERILVGHPANPPFLLPVIKVAPSAFTSQRFADRAADLFVRAGLKPIAVRR